MPPEIRPTGYPLRKRKVTTVNGVEDRSLPDDPHEVAKILRERKRAATPAGRLRAKIAADLKKRAR